MIIAGFDILLFGKKGFSSLARAKRVMVRTKGKKGQWVELVFTKKHRLKAEKEFALYKLLQKLSYARDLAAKKKKPKKAAKRKKKKPAPKRIIKKEEVEEIIEERAPEIASKIKFNAPVITDKVLTTRQRKTIDIRKYEFTLKHELNFANGNEYEAPAANEFIRAVKKEFEKIYKIHGKKSYLVRLAHEYSNFVNYYDAYPKERPPAKDGVEATDKGFGGISINRQVYNSQAHINDQFDKFLPIFYLSSMSKYLNFSSPSTEFNFSGFMIEVTLRHIVKPNKK